jgi:hypothetical protein
MTKDTLVYWQQFGNKKSVRQNNMCKIKKKGVFFVGNLNK